jgi:hypothetical protein
MIRPVTLVTMMMAALSGAYLFGVKHRAQVLDDQLAAVTQASRLDDQRISVLQAQWSLEIDHNRLQSLTEKFSGLAAMKPSQLVTLAELSRALPPAGSAAPEDNPVAPADVIQAAADESAVPAEMADAAPAAAPAAADGLPLPPPPAPVMAGVLLASAEVTAPRKRVARVSLRTAARKSHFEASELAENLVANLPAARPLAGAEVVGAKIVAANAAADEAGGQGGSLLGMAADLAPPQPLAGASN